MQILFIVEPGSILQLYTFSSFFLKLMIALFFLLPGFPYFHCSLHPQCYSLCTCLQITFSIILKHISSTCLLYGNNSLVEPSVLLLQYDLNSLKLNIQQLSGAYLTRQSNNGKILLDFSLLKSTVKLSLICILQTYIK